LNVDRAVFAGYGRPEGIDDEGILKSLLAFDAERSVVPHPQRILELAVPSEPRGCLLRACEYSSPDAKRATSRACRVTGPRGPGELLVPGGVRTPNADDRAAGEPDRRGVGPA
jgi:hypothetical protein